MTPETTTLFNNQLITKSDLVEFKNNLIDEIKEILNINPQAKKWVRSGEAKKILNISPSTLQKLRMNKSLNFTMIGSIHYYKFEDIQKLLEEGKPDQYLTKS